MRRGSVLPLQKCSTMALLSGLSLQLFERPSYVYYKILYIYIYIYILPLLLSLLNSQFFAQHRLKLF